MTEEQFCETICAAATRLGIKIARTAEFGFYWYDPVGKFIPGKPGCNDKESLYFACLELQSYLSNAPRKAT